MGLFRNKTYPWKCSMCGQEFESDFKPSPGRVHNCKKCDERILLGKIAAAKTESEKKGLLNALVVVRTRRA
ncbi:MAG: hypothetical protein AABX64_03155 [Nanoarchaeota archaeon]